MVWFLIGSDFATVLVFYIRGETILGEIQSIENVLGLLLLLLFLLFNLDIMCLLLTFRRVTPIIIELFKVIGVVAYSSVSVA